MKLEHLCEISLSYDDHGLTLIRPFAGHEAQGYGTGSGTVTGERLSGPLRWSNYPRGTDSGVLMPDVRGIITTDDGPVLFEFHGYSLPPDPGSQIRSVTAAITFRTDSDKHRWLNTALVVHEGSIDFATMTATFPAYVCVPATPG